MLHVKYTKRELAALIRLGIRAARSNRITNAEMQLIMMGIHDALAGRYERLWTQIAELGVVLGLAPNGRPFGADLPKR